MKQKKMSETRLSGLNDEQDLGKKKILKSSNQQNPDSDNMKQGWEIKKLGEVCDFQNGFAFQSKSYKESGLPILRITNIQNDEIDTKELVYFDTKDYKVNLDRFKVYQGDLLIAMSGATTGKLGINNSETVFYLNQRVGKFIPKKFLNKAFLYYFLTTKVEESLRIAAGAAQPNLSTEQINNFEIPLPPLPEQQRIVSILDEAFTAIAKAKANAEQNLKNAKELFESYLQGVFERRGLNHDSTDLLDSPDSKNKKKSSNQDNQKNQGSDNGDGWEEKKLGEVCQIIMGQSPKGETYNTDGNGVPLINGPVEFGPEPFSKTIMSKYTTEPTKYCKEGDLILCVRGSTTGRINIAGFDACIGRGVAAIRYSKNQEWINYFILSSRQKIYDLGTGATFPNVSSEILKNIPIPIPPLKQQQTIVQRLDALRAETQKLEAIYQKKIDDLEELKKSILQKAFSGQLSESGLEGLKDEQDLSAANKSSKSLNPVNPDADKHLANPLIQKS